MFTIVPDPDNLTSSLRYVASHRTFGPLSVTNKSANDTLSSKQGDKRFQNKYTVIGASPVGTSVPNRSCRYTHTHTHTHTLLNNTVNTPKEHPQHKVEGMELDVTMVGRDLRFEAYVGGWITSQTHNGR